MKKTKNLLYLSISLIVSIIIIYFVLENFKTVVPKEGGSLVEGLTEKPRFINPILSTSNTDKSLSYLIYSPLLELDSEGNITSNSLAESYKISEDKTSYEITIKDNIYFHDGEKLTTKDIAYTISKIQDPITKSFLIGRWFGIETESTDNTVITFTLKNPSYNFIDNLKIRILPRHIWDAIPDEEFSFSEFNVNPIGSGPYMIDKIIRTEAGGIEYFDLKPNSRYFSDSPLIQKIKFVLFSSNEAALDALKKGDINSYGGASLSDLKNVNIKDSDIQRINTSRLFSVFFNLESENFVTSDENIKKYITIILNNKSYLDLILGESYKTESSILPAAYGYSFGALEEDEGGISSLQEEIKEDDWAINSDGYFQKDDQILEINLSTPDSEDLINISNEMKNKLEKLGVKLNLKVYNSSALQEEILRDRNFQVLLFGMQFDAIPSMYPFWHSFSIDYPGINISGYSNSEVDLKIEELQAEFDLEKRATLYGEIIATIDSESPVIPLYSPYYIYSQTNNITKPDIINLITSPEERFYGIEHWHTKTEKILNIFK